MSSRPAKFLALTGVSAALALGGTGLAQASPDNSRHREDHHHCKKLHGKKKRECERKHHHRS